MKIAAAALLCFLLISCNTEKDKVLEVKEDGLLYQEGSEVPFTGVEKGFVQNKHIEYEVLNGEKHGYFKIMGAKGNVEISGHISHNKYEGKWEYFYADGRLESVGFFKDHQPSGEWKFYFPNGNLKETGVYLEGKKEGEWKTFFENGEVESVKQFSEGQIVDDKPEKEKI